MTACNMCTCDILPYIRNRMSRKLCSPGSLAGRRILCENCHGRALRKCVFVLLCVCVCVSNTSHPPLSEMISQNGNNSGSGERCRCESCMLLRCDGGEDEEEEELSLSPLAPRRTWTPSEPPDSSNVMRYCRRELSHHVIGSCWVRDPIPGAGRKMIARYRDGIL